MVAMLAMIMGCKDASSELPGPTITVSGTSSMRVPTDRVVFSVGVESQASDARQAFASNTQKVEAVVAALRRKGVQAKDVQTSDLDISSRDERGEKIAGYRVSTMVTVTREDPSGVADLLQTAVAAGANQAGGLRFSVADPAQLQSRGLELAFQDAKSKAESLAKLSNRRLGPVQSINEAPSWNLGGALNNLASLGYVSSGVQSGSQEVHFGITVVFEVQK
jgi:uncharacterized protein YggE